MNLKDPRFWFLFVKIEIESAASASGYSYWPNILEAYLGLRNVCTHFSQ
ncbi:MAG: hypothetical protein XD88_1947 [Methanocalculus sp. 52_23]|nr:MAG: hypothetical protein XD88_1947 [Methanocalculus sp. 52_23]